MFYAGDDLGVCPAGGSHDDSTSGSYVLSNSGVGQNNWKHCNQCEGLFYSAGRLGVCPAHSASESGLYFVPTSPGSGQEGWFYCRKCQGMFYAGGLSLVCAAGGPHDSSASGNYYIPQSPGSGEPGWKRCSKCAGLFYLADNNYGGCPAGGAHDDALGQNYFLPQSESVGAQAGWKYCNQCQGLFYAGNNLGVCPVPQSHTEIGSDNYVLAQSNDGSRSVQPGWKYCHRCQGLFFAAGGTGVCPARVAGEANQPNVHDQTGSGTYFLTQLGGSLNYILGNNCNNLTGVMVVITITQEIAFASAAGPTAGFSFQLNAYSNNTSTTVGWQQYSILVAGNEIQWKVDNWPVALANPPVDLINSDNSSFPQSLLSLPGPNLPAGYVLSITLHIDLNTANVFAATFAVDGNQANQLAIKYVDLTTLTLTGSTSLATSADLAPIVAFELDVVGPYNAEAVQLSSGAGTITYYTDALTPSDLVPPCGVDRNIVTAEWANSNYGALPAALSSPFIQSFNMTEFDAPTPQLAASIVPSETGYGVSWSGNGFGFAANVVLSLVGLAGQTRPKMIGNSTVDATGSISGFYDYVCNGSVPSPTVYLEASIGNAILAVSENFPFACT